MTPMTAARLASPESQPTIRRLLFLCWPAVSVLEAGETEPFLAMAASTACRTSFRAGSSASDAVSSAAIC